MDNWSTLIRIVDVHQWGAVQPSTRLRTVGQSERIIFHHTAGHHRHIKGASTLLDAERYARDVQHFHMVTNGWSDSGHNFMVMRSGVVLQGRWLTIATIQAGHMVRSAHCPGQNDQIGIEHEHFGDELMPAVQREASARLMAWIALNYRRRTVLPVSPHRAYFATSCPANLESNIDGIRHRAAALLTRYRGD